MNSEMYDVIIVGAGPGGCTCAANLLSTGLKIALIDKCEFPREKLCGGILGSEAIEAIDRLPEAIKNQFYTFEQKLSVVNYDITVPNGKTYKFRSNPKTDKDFKCYTVDRYYLDDMFLNSVSEYANVDLLLEEEVEEIYYESDCIAVKLTGKNDITVKGKALIGADGSNSKVAQTLIPNYETVNENDLMAIRGIYANVEPKYKEPTIELYFFKDIFPGYFWIYPLANGLTNSGIVIKRKNAEASEININDYLSEIIQKHKDIAPRFKSANLVQLTGQTSLPLNLNRKRISGERFMLIGDAASLIDPILGHGISNAIVSGEFAAWRVTKSFITDDFSSEFFEYYDDRVYDKLAESFNYQYIISEFLHKFPQLFNFAVKKFNNKNNAFDLLSPTKLKEIEKRMVKLDSKFYFDLLMS